MPKYVIIQPVEHDQVRYAEGDIISLSEEAAVPLLKVGAVAPVGKTRPAAEGTAEGEIA